MIFIENRESLDDKLKKLENAYLAKQLSEREYELWKRVYHAEAAENMNSAGLRKRKRVR
jgi:hypothetical protein